jgi:hypothetical protein
VGAFGAYGGGDVGAEVAGGADVFCELGMDLAELGDFVHGGASRTASEDRGASKARSGCQARRAAVMSARPKRSCEGMGSPHKKPYSRSNGTSFFGARRGQGKLAHEDLRLVAVYRPKGHSGGALVFAAVILRDKEIDAAWFGGKVRRSGGEAGTNNHKGLPIGAEVMLAWIDRHIKIGVCMSGAKPVAIKAEASRGPWARSEIGVILKEIDKSFSRVGLCERMLRLVGFHVELGVDVAAAGSCCGDRGGILREACCAEEEDQNRKKSFHVLAPKTASNDLATYAGKRDVGALAW